LNEKIYNWSKDFFKTNEDKGEPTVSSLNRKPMKPLIAIGSAGLLGHGVNNTPISPETYKAFTDAGLRDVDKMSDLAKDSIDAKTYSELASAGITNINTIKKHKAKTAEQLKQMKRIAKYSQKALENVNNEDKVDVDGVGVPGAFYKLAEGFDAEPATIKDLWENLEDFM